MMGTTPTQRRVISILARLQAQGDYGPTLAEIREIMGGGSRSTTHRMIEALIERGLISRLPNRARSIVVSPEAMKRYGPPILINGRAYRYIPVTRIGFGKGRA